MVLFLAAANRDPRKWDQPERFDLARQTSGHVGFGFGIHQCLGQISCLASDIGFNIDNLRDGFWQLTIDGLSWGAIYALVAVGYTLVFGVLRLINFAHSEIFMLGMFGAYFSIVEITVSPNASRLASFQPPSMSYGAYCTKHDIT